eukprot:TRINITY_DN42587_c0_g1_i1.p2 TRINITY_DN42587_c0_g1~~TRINITY_DN42587_c0_g1_i1.p2  ORF type:complete len:297 (+),score=11.15 TRINITY_DN42587_c0_g1_i1:37-927(+)
MERLIGHSEAMAHALGYCVCCLDSSFHAVRCVCAAWKTAVSSVACWSDAALDLSSLPESYMDILVEMSSAWSCIASARYDCNFSRLMRVALANLLRESASGDMALEGPCGMHYIAFGSIFQGDRRGAALGLLPARRTDHEVTYSVKILRVIGQGPAFGLCAESPALLVKREEVADCRGEVFDWGHVCYVLARRGDGYFWDQSAGGRQPGRNMFCDDAIRRIGRDRGNPAQVWLGLRSGDIVTVRLQEDERASRFELSVNGTPIGMAACYFELGEDLYPMIGCDHWTPDDPQFEFLS